MLSKLNRMLQSSRDIFLLILSIVIMGTSYPVFRGEKEPVHYVLFGIAALLFVLTLINVILLIARIRSKIYFYINSGLQLVSSFILGGFFFPLFILFIINLIILFTLRERKKQV
ncbi:hypothetical protein HY638_03740 [Candidatus Woesearchaeota archaeon]|nr:hypothetical protein [Candidatus Woesearchaeota archaeon]